MFIRRKQPIIYLSFEWCFSSYFSPSSFTQYKLIENVSYKGLIVAQKWNSLCQPFAIVNTIYRMLHFNGKSKFEIILTILNEIKLRLGL